MANISAAELREEIVAQLKGADLNNVSAKKVRQALEKQFDEDLSDRKKEIDEMIMEVIDSTEQDASADDGSADEDEGGGDGQNGRDKADGSDESYKADSSDEDEAPRRKGRKKRAATDESDDDESYSPRKRAAPKARSSRKPADSGDDDDYEAKKKPSKRGKATRGGGKKSGGGGGGTGYTKQCRLSPELASLMGAERMARHEVIKKMWSLIKENNMYDPKNKQFAICDDAMKEVIGVKRFRTFGMMKHLKGHFLSD